MTHNETYTLCFDRPYFYTYADATFRDLEGNTVRFQDFPRFIRHNFAEEAFRFEDEGYSAHGVGRFTDPEGRPVRRQDMPEAVQRRMSDAETLWLDCWDC